MSEKKAGTAHSRRHCLLLQLPAVRVVEKNTFTVRVEKVKSRIGGWVCNKAATQHQDCAPNRDKGGFLTERAITRSSFGDPCAALPVLGILKNLSNHSFKQCLAMAFFQCCNAAQGSPQLLGLVFVSKELCLPFRDVILGILLLSSFHRSPLRGGN